MQAEPPLQANSPSEVPASAESDAPDVSFQDLATAERFGVNDVFDPADNVSGGARYFRWLLDRFENRTEFALAAYNAGENVVLRYKGIPPYRETRDYVARVLQKAKVNGRVIKSRPGQ